MKNNSSKLKIRFFKPFCLLLAIVSLGLYPMDGLSSPFFQGQTTAKVTGTVVSAADNLPVIGANLLVKGTTRGTITDLDGKFEIDATPEEVLVISFIGYATVEVVV